MTLSVKHAFTNPKGDPADATIVRPSNWNAEHTMLMATAKVLGRSTAGTGAVEEMSATTAGLALLSAADAAAQLAIVVPSASITYAKIQNISATAKLLGRATAGAGVTEEVGLGVGLAISGSNLVAPAFPPPGAFKNLSIKVASNTTVTVAADYVTTTNATNFLTTAVSSTVNLGTSVAVDALDTGTIATATWYYIWVIVKADGTTKCIASLQSTANATFLTSLAAIASGAYTYYARIGAVRTISASATLYGTWQFGNRAQYVVGLAQTSVIPVMSVGAVGTYSNTSPTLSAVAVANFVPPTASEIKIFAQNFHGSGSGAEMLVAPSTAWGGANNGPRGSNSMAWPFYTNNSIAVSAQVDFIIEGANIGVASSAGGGGVSCAGWVDNI